MIVSRDVTGSVSESVALDLANRRKKKTTDHEEEEEEVTDASVYPTLEAALEALVDHQRSTLLLGNIFVIGGAEIYGHALRLNGYKLRIIMTTIVRCNGGSFPCDTFFPVDAEHLVPEYGWRGVSADELSGWVGENVSSAWRDEGDVSMRIVGYERL